VHQEQQLFHKVISYAKQTEKLHIKNSLDNTLNSKAYLRTCKTAPIRSIKNFDILLHALIAVGDLMFLGKQDFDFAQILITLPKFVQILLKIRPNLPQKIS